MPTDVKAKCAFDEEKVIFAQMRNVHDGLLCIFTASEKIVQNFFLSCSVAIVRDGNRGTTLNLIINYIHKLVDLQWSIVAPLWSANRSHSHEN